MRPHLARPLEALAVLVVLKLQFGEMPGGARTRVRIAPTLADNRRNCDDEVSCVCSAHGTVLLHEEDEHSDDCRVGARRGGTERRNRLANGVFDGFDPTLQAERTDARQVNEATEGG